MTYNHHPRTPEEIEAEIERDRSALNRTIGTIQDRISVDGMMSSLTESVTEHGAEVSDAVVRTVRRNPAAVALTVAGLAWLAYSNGKPARKSSEARYPVPATAPQYNRDYAEPRHLADRAPLSPEMPPRSVVPSGNGATAQMDDGTSPWDTAQKNVRDARDRMARGVADARDAAGRHYAEARAGAQKRYASVRDEAVERADRIGTSARHLRDRISDGTQHMSEEARRRVIAARTQAYEAQVKAEYLARKGRDRATGFFEEQPLVVGALALAVGAAIGGALPRTSRENEAFGAYRDDLFSEAERIYAEEKAKLKSVAEDTAEAAKAQASDLVDDAKGAVKSAEKDVENRVENIADAAKNSAKSNGLGNSVKS
ncbi:hypothetical protein ATO6_05925 [Oceanicola sp. 22II-s10i]|uniref:DUF3618 domain-containing protein n=1 Tax=Oceanicola sp. 22II-s10i TaxID=1317116 RepID=UPI000B52730C|nr:DUF3618 domain-containing protein [Oceanicola sp. 22II-s10i]OWU86357.1 hypothetical protein ATO6_05925 [Oceanicola sp. 22II-s10i]